MAFVKSIPFEFQGVQTSARINVSSTGIFSVSLPKEAAAALGVRDKIEAPTIEEVQKEFAAITKRYREAKTTESLWLDVYFGMNNKFNRDKEGHSLIQGYHSTVKNTARFFEPNYDSHLETSSIVLGWRVLWKTDIDGVEHWNLAHIDIFYRGEDPQPGSIHGYVKLGNHASAKGITIPYTPEAVETLKKMREGFRGICEKVFHFLNVPAEEVAARLIQSSDSFKLLN